MNVLSMGSSTSTSSLNSQSGRNSSEENQSVEETLQVSRKDQSEYDSDGMVGKKGLFVRMITALRHIPCIACCFNNSGSEKDVYGYKPVANSLNQADDPVGYPENEVDKVDTPPSVDNAKQWLSDIIVSRFNEVEYQMLKIPASAKSVNQDHHSEGTTADEQSEVNNLADNDLTQVVSKMQPIVGSLKDKIGGTEPDLQKFSQYLNSIISSLGDSNAPSLKNKDDSEYDFSVQVFTTYQLLICLFGDLHYYLHTMDGEKFSDERPVVLENMINRGKTVGENILCNKIMSKYRKDYIKPSNLPLVL